MDRFNFEKLAVILRKNLIKGLDPSQRWNFIHCPDGLDQEILIANIEIFIRDHLAEWVGLIIEVIPFVKEEDIASVAQEKPTPMGLKFRALHDFLEDKNIPSARSFNKSLSLWSGVKAREMAMSNPLTRCDSTVPTIAMMFCAVSSIQEAQGRFDGLIQMLANGTSRLFCLNAKEIAHVYISSEKNSEPAGFTRDNNFWTDELPTLRYLLATGVIRDILIHLFDHKTGTWAAAKSMASGEISSLRITRRSAYTFCPSDSRHISSPYELIPESADDVRFKELNMSKERREAWEKSAPRPALTFGKLQEMARQLSKAVNNKKEAREARVLSA